MDWGWIVVGVAASCVVLYAGACAAVARAERRRRRRNGWARRYGWGEHPAYDVGRERRARGDQAS